MVIIDLLWSELNHRLLRYNRFEQTIVLGVNLSSLIPSGNRGWGAQEFLVRFAEYVSVERGLAAITNLGKSIKHHRVLFRYLGVLGQLDLRKVPSTVILPVLTLPDRIHVQSVAFLCRSERLFPPIPYLIETTLVTSVVLKALQSLIQIGVDEDGSFGGSHLTTGPQAGSSDTQIRVEVLLLLLFLTIRGLEQRNRPIWLYDVHCFHPDSSWLRTIIMVFKDRNERDWFLWTLAHQLLRIFTFVWLEFGGLHIFVCLFVDLDISSNWLVRLSTATLRNLLLNLSFLLPIFLRLNCIMLAIRVGLVRLNFLLGNFDPCIPTMLLHISIRRIVAFSCNDSTKAYLFS